MDKISTPTLPTDRNSNQEKKIDQGDIRNSPTLKIQLSSLRREKNKSLISFSNRKNKWESINLVESVISANNSPLLIPIKHPLFFNKIPISDQQSQEILRYPIQHGTSRTEDEEALERIKKSYLLHNENNYANNDKSVQNNISNKHSNNTIETIKNEFKASEIAKLKAFHKFEEMKDRYGEIPMVKEKGKPFIQPLLKLSFPKKFQIKIDEFKKKYNSEPERVKSFHFGDNRRNQQPSKNKKDMDLMHKITSKLNNETNTTLKKVINLDYINTNK